MNAHRTTDAPANARCEITGDLLPTDDLVALDHLRTALSDRIRRDFPTLSQGALISRREVDHYRMLYVEDLLKEERGELTEIDRQVAKSLAEGELVSQNVE